MMSPYPDTFSLLQAYICTCLCSYSLKLQDQRKSNKYHFKRLWFDLVQAEPNQCKNSHTCGEDATTRPLELYVHVAIMCIYVLNLFAYIFVYMYICTSTSIPMAMQVYMYIKLPPTCTNVVVTHLFEYIYAYMNKNIVIHVHVCIQIYLNILFCSYMYGAWDICI